MTSILHKAGIAIETWMLPIFERHLNQAGYTFKNVGQLANDLLLLSVETTNIDALTEVLLAATGEAVRTGAPSA